MKIRISRLSRVLAAVAGSMALVLAGPIPPAHASGQLELSTDGVTWTAGEVPLEFERDVWVPGDTDQASMLVRNASTQVARVHAEVLIDERLPADITMTGTLGGGPGEPIVGSHDTTNDVMLAPNETATATLAVTAGANAEMRQHATVTLVFHAVGGVGGHPGDGGDGGGDTSTPDTGGDGTADAGRDGTPGADRDTDAAGPDRDAGTPRPGGDAASADQVKGDRRGAGELPATGAPDVGWVVALGALLVGTGLALVARRRRDKGEEEVSS